MVVILAAAMRSVDAGTAATLVFEV